MKEDVLELQGIESPDVVDLHSIGSLVPLFGYLKTSDAGIGAKDADVVTTIVQNNPRSQQLVMESLLSNFTSHPDLTVHTEALGVISSLIQNNQAGIAAFDLVNGYAVLGYALCSEREGA
nr:PREDICTED: uncharacterized protein LOC108953326 [Musa acuminata subsp. malaccensis]